MESVIKMEHVCVTETILAKSVRCACLLTLVLLVKYVLFFIFLLILLFFNSLFFLIIKMIDCDPTVNCSSNGHCNGTGVCECRPEFAGDKCEKCNIHLHGPNCAFCMQLLL